MQKFEIRRVGVGDADALCAFYNGLSAPSKRTFRPLGVVTTVAAFRAVIQDNESEGKHDLIAVHDGQIVGWGFLWDIGSEEPMLGLAVADLWQGQGLGSRLIDRVMQTAHELGLPRVHLTVVQDNVVAWNLYQSRGFVRWGEFVGTDGLAYYQMVADLRVGKTST